MKAFLRDYWIPLLLALLLITPIALLVLNIHKKEHVSSEKILFTNFDPAKCSIRSVVWFDDEGKPVAAKARVCDVKE